MVQDVFPIAMTFLTDERDEMTHEIAQMFVLKIIRMLFFNCTPTAASITYPFATVASSGLKKPSQTLVSALGSEINKPGAGTMAWHLATPHPHRGAPSPVTATARMWPWALVRSQGKTPWAMGEEEKPISEEPPKGGEPKSQGMWSQVLVPQQKRMAQV